MNWKKYGTWLVALGALNWGVIGLSALFGKTINVINLILGGMPKLEAFVYLLVGVAALMQLKKD